jgi:hypothetical protein
MRARGHPLLRTAFIFSHGNRLLKKTAVAAKFVMLVPAYIMLGQAPAGIQNSPKKLDSCFHENDGKWAKNSFSTGC